MRPLKKTDIRIASTELSRVQGEGRLRTRRVTQKLFMRENSWWKALKLFLKRPGLMWNLHNTSELIPQLPLTIGVLTHRPPTKEPILSLYITSSETSNTTIGNLLWSGCLRKSRKPVHRLSN